MIDEYTQESLAIDVARNFSVQGLSCVYPQRQWPEFISSAVQKWLEKAGVKTLYIAPGSPWENGHIESFNSELLNRELFLSITKLRYVVDQYRMDYNYYRSHSSLDYMATATLRRYVLSKALVPSALLKTRRTVVKDSHEELDQKNGAGQSERQGSKAEKEAQYPSVIF